MIHYQPRKIFIFLYMILKLTTTETATETTTATHTTPLPTSTSTSDTEETNYFYKFSSFSTSVTRAEGETELKYETITNSPKENVETSTDIKINRFKSNLVDTTNKTAATTPTETVNETSTKTAKTETVSKSTPKNEIKLGISNETDTVPKTKTTTKNLIETETLSTTKTTTENINAYGDGYDDDGYDYFYETIHKPKSIHIPMNKIWTVAGTEIVNEHSTTAPIMETQTVFVVSKLEARQTSDAFTDSFVDDEDFGGDFKGLGTSSLKELTTELIHVKNINYVTSTTSKAGSGADYDYQTSTQDGTKIGLGHNTNPFWDSNVDDKNLQDGFEGSGFSESKNTVVTTAKAETSITEIYFKDKGTNRGFSVSGLIPSTYNIKTDFKCNLTGNLIPLKYLCDGYSHCGDGSDEFNCTSRVCSQNKFECENGNCIHQMFRCTADANEECGDESGLRNCPPIRECSKNEFKCGQAKCIPRSYMCDGKNDCDDGSDERDCDEVTCRQNEFHCGTGRCIPDSYRCDGDFFDCADGNGSDEVNCTSCTYGAFKCATENVCVFTSSLCDSVPNCQDESDEDELACPNRTTPKEWQEFWHDDVKKARNISLVYSDDHVVVYYGQEMKSPSTTTTTATTWPFHLLSKAWKYMKETYGNSSRLYVVLHHENQNENSLQGCERLTFENAQTRNLISCGTEEINGGWFMETALKFETLFSNFGDIVLNNGQEISFYNAGDFHHRCMDLNSIIFYDLYLHLKGDPSADLMEWKLKQMNIKVGINDAYCFRDWFLPIYETYGGTHAIQEYFKYSTDAWKWNLHMNRIFPLPSALNIGKFVHYWSQSAGTDLQPIAAKVFLWSQTVHQDWISARKNDSFNRTYSLNNYTVAYLDENVGFYTKNYTNPTPFLSLYKTISNSLKYLKMQYGPFPFRGNSTNLYLSWENGTIKETSNLHCIDLNTNEIHQKSTSFPFVRFILCDDPTAKVMSAPKFNTKKSEILDSFLVKMSEMAVNLNYEARLSASSRTSGSSTPLNFTTWNLKSILVYDIYAHLERKEDVLRWANLNMQKNSSFPRKNTFWFRDWYLPIYGQRGGGSLFLKKFVSLSNVATILLTSGQNGTKFNLGDFIHVSSTTKRANLRGLANTVFGWNKFNETVFLKERQFISKSIYLGYRCRKSQFTCLSTHCIPSDLKCNGVDDCSDKSDETKCTRCTGNAFKCITNDKCITINELCNLKIDCLDGSDEIRATCPITNYTLAFTDKSISIYFKNSLPSPPPPYSTISRVWTNLQNTYMNAKDVSRITVIFDNPLTNNESFVTMTMCAHALYAVQKSDFKNGAPDCRTNTSLKFSSTANSTVLLDTIVGQMANLTLKGFYHGRSDGESAYLSGGKLRSILIHDIYSSLGWTEEVRRWDALESGKENSSGGGGGGGGGGNVKLGYVNWYLPIYEHNGGSQVLGNIFDIFKIMSLGPWLVGFDYKKPNVGQFVHIWSMAAKLNLVSLANASLGWNDTFKTQFETVRKISMSFNDYSDNCPAGEFLCDLNRCLTRQSRCNVRLDCIDGSDEDNCKIGSTCDEHGFLCGDGQCVKKHWKCDGLRDCRDSSDETNCTQCSTNAFRCNTGNRCIQLTGLCDLSNDCPDGSDENDVNCPENFTPRGPSTTFSTEPTKKINSTPRGPSVTFSTEPTKKITSTPRGPSVTFSADRESTEKITSKCNWTTKYEFENITFNFINLERLSMQPYYKEISAAWNYVRDNYGTSTGQTNASLSITLHNTTTTKENSQNPVCISDIKNSQIVNLYNINCFTNSTLNSETEASRLVQETIIQIGLNVLLPHTRANNWVARNVSGLSLESIIAYDIQSAGLRRTNDALQEISNTLKLKAAKPSKDEINWFRDWYLPLYVFYGNSTALKKLIDILQTQQQFFAAKITDNSTVPQQRRLNKGEFVHFWSEAVGVNLLEIAQKSLNWTKENENDFLKAQVEFSTDFLGRTNETNTTTPVTSHTQPQILILEEKTLERAQLLKKVYTDDHVTIFFDSSIPLDVDWPFNLLSTYWRYMKLFPNKFQSTHPHLNVIFHDKIEKDCMYSESFRISNQLFNNTIDCGHKEGSGDTWAVETLQNLEIVTNISTVVVNDSDFSSTLSKPNRTDSRNQTKEDTSFSLAGVALFHIVVFDRYLRDMRLKDAHSWIQNKSTKIRVAEFNSHFWFRDWLLPIYTKYGGISVLDRFVQLNEQRHQRMLSGTTDISETSLAGVAQMSLGELVHLWSTAAGTNLRDMAVKVHGWNEDIQKQFCEAREVLSFNVSNSDDECRDEKPKPDFLRDNKYSISFGSLVSLLVLGLLGFGIKMYIYEKRIQYMSQQIRNLTKEEIYEFFNGDPSSSREGENGLIHAMPFKSEYELPREDFSIGFLALVSCEFGVVHYGTLKRRLKPGTSAIILENNADTETEVAIKMVKPNVEVSLFKALLTEIKIMAHLGKHPNITSLLGTFTHNIKNRELYVVLEFCAKGDLLQHLRGQRTNFHDIFKVNEEKGATRISGNNKETTQMEPEPQNPETEETSKNAVTLTPLQNDTSSSPAAESTAKLSTIDLIKWSIQIAEGMSYLATKKVIHGDLAARNVLLTANSVAKISDFGLSRQLFNYSNYMKTSTTPLPWRWLALESLTDREFSIQSDIWAFAVTMWEIFTLGKFPYPGRTWDHEFVNELTAGQRLNSPDFGNKEIYNVMMDCMKKDPAERITSHQIISRLQRIEAYTKSMAHKENFGQEGDSYMTLEAKKKTVESVLLNLESAGGRK